MTTHKNLLPQIMVFDLDGTLTESKQRISGEMADLLAELLKHIRVAVMSGGGMKQFERQLLNFLPPETALTNLYLFPDNAAQCFVYRNNAWHAQYDNALSASERDRILMALGEALEEIGLADAPIRIWGERIENRGAEIAFSPLGQQAPLQEKQQWHSAHDDLRRNLHEALNKRLPEFANSMGGLTSIDITRKGIDKAYGVQRLRELTHADIGQMLYVGDALEEGGNDAVVVPTGIPTHAVFGPEETRELIEEILHAQGNHQAAHPSSTK